MRAVVQRVSQARVTRRILADAGLSAPVVEALTRWSDGPGPVLDDEARGNMFKHMSVKAA